MTGARTSLPERSELVRILSQAPEASAFQGAWRFHPLIQSSGWRDPASTFPQRPNFSAFASATQYLLHSKLPFSLYVSPAAHPLHDTKLRTQGWESNKAVQIFPDMEGSSNIPASHVCVVSAAKLGKNQIHWPLQYEDSAGGTSLGVQGLKIHLPIQGTQVRSLVGGLRSHTPQATKPTPCNQSARLLQQ